MFEELNKIKEIKSLSELVLTIDGVEPLDFLGENNSKLNFIKTKYPDLQIISRGNSLKITGDKKQTQELKAKVEVLVRYLKEHKELPMSAMDTIMAGMNPFDNKSIETPSSNGNIILHNKDGFPIRARTVNQKKLVDASERADIVFAVGPAGTGKTYTAVALAVKALKNRLVKKIILTRPAVEAGENLGFLPGTFDAKLAPYLMPMYDVLADFLSFEEIKKLEESKKIITLPMAFQRGITFKRAYVVADEAQNASPKQIHLLLTRLSKRSKIVVTGDVFQSDLRGDKPNGLIDGIKRLQGIPDMSFVEFDYSSNCREPIVSNIDARYRKEQFHSERILPEIMKELNLNYVEPEPGVVDFDEYKETHK